MRSQERCFKTNAVLKQIKYCPSCLFVILEFNKMNIALLTLLFHFLQVSTGNEFIFFDDVIIL